MNTKPNAVRVLCFGDSNTWGYIPGSKHERYAADVRWTGVVQQELGDGYEVIEEGLNSRTIESSDTRPGKEGRNAAEYILPCLDTHDPLDLVIVMLGTNELKAAFNLSVEGIAGMMRRLLEVIAGRQSQFRGTTPKLILVAPPLVNEHTDYCQEGGKYIGASRKSAELVEAYRRLAEEFDIAFFDVTRKLQTGTDGVHLTADSHGVFGAEMASRVHGVLG